MPLRPSLSWLDKVVRDSSIYSWLNDSFLAGVPKPASVDSTHSCMHGRWRVKQWRNRGKQTRGQTQRRLFKTFIKITSISILKQNNTSTFNDPCPLTFNAKISPTKCKNNWRVSVTHGERLKTDQLMYRDDDQIRAPYWASHTLRLQICFIQWEKKKKKTGGPGTKGMLSGLVTFHPPPPQSASFA